MFRFFVFLPVTDRRCFHSPKGHVLGSAGDEPRASRAPGVASMDRNDVAPPTYNDNISPDEREQQRRERAAAAEKRAKQMGGTAKPKKKDTSGQPLRGPNTQNTMRWTAG